MTIDGKQIWQAIEAEGILTKNHLPSQNQILQDYVERELPKALAHLLDEIATGENITRAQVAHWEHQLRVGFCRKMAEAQEPLLKYLAAGKGLRFDPDVTERLKEKLEIKITHFVFELNKVLKDFDGFLQDVGETQESFLYTMPFNHRLRPLVIRGKITIAEILLEQPSIILGIALPKNGQIP